MKTKSLFLLLTVATFSLFSCKKENTINLAVTDFDKQNEILKKGKQVLEFLRYLDGLPEDERNAGLTAFIERGNRQGLTKELNTTTSTMRMDDWTDEEMSTWAYLPSNAAITPETPNGSTTKVTWRVIRNTLDLWRVISKETLSCVRFPTKKYTASSHFSSYLEGITGNAVEWTQSGIEVGHSDYTAYSIISGIIVTPLWNNPVNTVKYFPINNVFN